MMHPLKIFLILIFSTSSSFSTEFLNLPPKVLDTSFGFTEGPLWLVDKKKWLFTDIPNNKVYSLNSKDELEVFDDNSGYANGLNVDSRGNIWFARHDSKISYLKKNGKEVIAASLYLGKRLNSPNDIAIASDGAVWFTDPNFGINLEGFGPELRNDEQPSRGVYQLKNGKLVLQIDSLTLPNGIAFSQNEKFLYVTDSADGIVYKFDYDGNNVSNKQPFAKVNSGKNVKPMADGIKVDSNGNLYVAAGPSGFAIFSPSGEQLELYSPDSGFISNIGFGGENNNKLMVTGQEKVFIYDIK